MKVSRLLARARLWCRNRLASRAEVTDAHEAFWKHMEEEAAQELRRRELHGALLAAACVILPSEGDMLLMEVQQPVVGNGDAMGVTAEIAQHLIGAAHGLFGIHDPASAIERTGQTEELLPVPVLGGWSVAA